MMWRPLVLAGLLILSIHGQRPSGRPSGRPGNNMDRPGNNQGQPGNNMNNQDRPGNNQDRPGNNMNRPGQNQGDRSGGMRNDQPRNINDRCTFVSKDACNETEGCSYGPIQGRGRGGPNGGRQGGGMGRDGGNGQGGNGRGPNQGGGNGGRRLQQGGGNRPGNNRPGNNQPGNNMNNRPGNDQNRPGDNQNRPGDNQNRPGQGVGQACANVCREFFQECSQRGNGGGGNGGGNGGGRDGGNGRGPNQGGRRLQQGGGNRGPGNNQPGNNMNNRPGNDQNNRPGGGNRPGFNNNNRDMGACLQQVANEQCLTCLEENQDGNDGIQEGCRSECLDLDEDECNPDDAPNCVWQTGVQQRGRGRGGMGGAQGRNGGGGNGGRGPRGPNQGGGGRRLQQGGGNRGPGNNENRPGNDQNRPGNNMGNRERPCSDECESTEDACKEKLNVGEGERPEQGAMRTCMDEEADDTCAECLESLGNRMGNDMDAMGQSGRCIPKAEEVTSGLLVTVTFYTDQECTELLEPGEDQNRDPNNECFGKDRNDCAEQEGCAYEQSGRGRLSTPHCRPENDRFRDGDRDGEERPCQEECSDVAAKCREQENDVRDRRAAMMAIRRCMTGFGDDDCSQCLQDNPRRESGDSDDESRDGGRDGGRRPGNGRRLQQDGQNRGPGNDQNRGRQDGGNRQGFNPNRQSMARGRGQDMRDRGRGGNPQQNRRIQENPMMRIIPVIDDEGEAKCSFDARGDQRSGIFRKTMCPSPNTIQDTLYTDMTCEEEADRETVPLVRGECMPLPMQGQPMERQQQRQGMGGDRRQGGPGQGGGRDGRRRLNDDEEMGDDGAPKAPTCDGDFNQGWSWETLKDLWDELTCDSGENEEGEGGDASSDDEDRPQNPCRFLNNNECQLNDECDLQQNVCLWNNAPQNRRNLYVVYDWKYLVEDGELTDQTYCWADDIMLNSADAYTELCEGAETEDECEPMGCKKWDGKKSKCKAQKKKIKCKKLGNKEDKKNSEAKMELCNMYSLMGCEWSEKKGCTGTVNLKKL